MRTNASARALQAEQKLRETVARSVRARRKALGLTNAQAAELCGIHARHLQKIEVADLNITLVTLAAVCRGLDLTVDDMLRDPPRSPVREQPRRPKRKKRTPTRA